MSVIEPQKATDKEPKIQVILTLLNDGNKGISVTGTATLGEVRDMLQQALNHIQDRITEGFSHAAMTQSLNPSRFSPSAMFNKLFKK